MEHRQESFASPKDLSIAGPLITATTTAATALGELQGHRRHPAHPIGIPSRLEILALAEPSKARA
jgi:hypothetical protein